MQPPGAPMRLAHAALAVLVATVWGFNFVVIKAGLESITPILFTALRFLFAAFPLVLFVPRPPVGWPALALYGLFSFVLQFTLLYLAIGAGLPTGIAALLLQSQVFMTILLSTLVLREGLTITQFAGLLAGLASMVLVGVRYLGGATAAGFLLALGSAASWAVGNLITKRMPGIAPLSLVAWASLLAAPPLFAAAWLIEGGPAFRHAIHNVSLVSLASVLFQAYPATILGFTAWASLLRRYPAARVTPFALLVPVTALLFGAMLLDEPLTWWKLLAAFLVLLGVGLSQGGRRR